MSKYEFLISLIVAAVLLFVVFMTYNACLAWMARDWIKAASCAATILGMLFVAALATGKIDPRI